MSSEIKILKEKLERSNKILNEIQRIAHLGNWEMDLKTSQVWCSDEAYKILGTSPQETWPALDYFLSFIHPEDFRRVKKIIDSSLTYFTNFSLCCRIIQPGGKVKYLYAQGIFEFNKKKKPIRLHGIIHDVSILKRMQNKICISEILGQEKERERLSKDLHDGLGQILVGINLQLKGLEKAIAHKDLELSKKLSGITSTVQDSIQEVRTISHNMSPHMLKKYGLVVSLQNICKSVTGTRLSFATNLEKPLRKSIEVILYRIAQELIANMLKHSKASKGKVTLKKKGKEIFLIVEDNGIGFNKKQSDGLGLSSIENRIDLLSGNLIISKSNSGGSRFEICIPY